MTAAATGRLGFGTIAVMGGGCYGSFYLRQLQRARAAGRVGFAAIVVVDRDRHCAAARALADPPDPTISVAVEDWASFLDRWLGGAVAAPAAHVHDAIVPSPLMPHLLADWVRTEARRVCAGDVTTATPEAVPGVPWQKVGADGTRYVSFATWTCPINCIEPARCPHTRGPRDWSLHATIPATAPPDVPVAVLPVTHRSHGVGMIDVADVLAARETVVRALRDGHAARVATASHCHGAVSQVRLTRRVTGA